MPKVCYAAFLCFGRWTDPYLHMAIWRRCPATRV